MKRRIAVLITVFNRKEHTLECLRSLYGATIPDGYSFDVYLTDDGSTDGTSEAIPDQYPSVKILSGSGNLFWNRGMINSWKEAAKRDYDYYLWLNNDTYITKDALEVLIKAVCETEHLSIICGVTKSKITGKTTYGGRTETSEVLEPNGDLRLCKYINGNIVLVPRAVYNILGTLDPLFIHAIGDFDYGLRAVNAGINLWITPLAIGYCESNPHLPAWCRPKVSFLRRCKSLYSPLGCSQPYYFFRFELRHYGLFVAVKHFFSIHLRLIKPSLWLK